MARGIAVEEIRRWNTREIVLVATIGVVFGLLFMAWAAVWQIFAVFGPLPGEIVVGFWFIAAPISAYIVRKPGAAFLGEFLAAVVELIAGSPWGLWVLASGAVQGLGCEVVFAAWKWKKYTIPVIMLSGVGATITSFILEYYTVPFFQLAPLLVVGMFIVRLFSGAILGGLLAKVLGDALARTGVLNNFALGRIRRARSK